MKTLLNIFMIIIGISLCAPATEISAGNLDSTNASHIKYAGPVLGPLIFVGVLAVFGYTAYTLIMKAAHSEFKQKNDANIVWYNKLAKNQGEFIEKISRGKKIAIGAGLATTALVGMCYRTELQNAAASFASSLLQKYKEPRIFSF